MGVDSSGSMSSECHIEARSELYGLITTLDGWTVSVVCCDTELHEIGTYSKEEGDDWSDIQFTMLGLGGTSLSPILKYADSVRDNTQEELTAVIIVTDGYFDGDELDSAIEQSGNDVPVIVLVVRNGSKTFTMRNAEVVFVK